MVVTRIRCSSPGLFLFRFVGVSTLSSISSRFCVLGGFGSQHCDKFLNGLDEMGSTLTVICRPGSSSAGLK